MKALFLIRDPFVEKYPELIQNARNLALDVKVINSDRGMNKQTLFEEVKDVDIIVVAIVKIDKEVIDAAPNLKYIIKFGAGYDNIDVDYAQEKNIVVSNAPGQNAQSAADLGFALMLTAARSIPMKDHEIKSSHWELSMGYEVYNKRLGIIGFGSIGQAIAKRAAGFDMVVSAYGNYKDYKAAKRYDVKFVELCDLLATSDFIIISTSLTEQNRDMINRETLSLMKSSAFLINISRGGLINEQDLIAALNEGEIKGAALDVFKDEPSINNLSKLPNVVATPHIGGATYEAVANISKITISNIAKFINNEELEYMVSKK
ncbi:phosphoglycerate dehydrogenase [Cytobacillus purgationiresistens]|uniref:D-3-phosphoglycerate dehydrogenase n=1 Tax=Cytobacillus purgationiresistens TaxID=863449 RepID=A0ABU0AEB6_9BACI|nr:phosphoglycerate dehydrogenase [Cytobacillus purgationiresistens]MDQ0268430.1 D-3-phosphoglycerate dehydrogenase [Cytobacillus purgationiresistens]